LGGVPPTGHPAYPGLPVRCRSGPRRSSRGLAPVLRLGWVGAAHPFIGQDRRVRFFNFAEVGLETPHLSLETSGKRHHWAQLLRQNWGFNFGIGAERISISFPSLSFEYVMKIALMSTLCLSAS